MLADRCNLRPIGDAIESGSFLDHGISPPPK